MPGASAPPRNKRGNDMTRSPIILAALAVATIALSAPAEARHQHATKSEPTRVLSPIDAAAIPPYPMAGQVKAAPGRRAAVRYRIDPNGMPLRAREARRASPAASNGERHMPATRAGMVTVPTAAGIHIVASAEFAPQAQAVIAAAVAEGMRFRRINCFSMARSHRSKSNHKAGNACDAYPSIPARIVRAAGLRSGCDFADCQHFDNARNVGGIAFWNRVKHSRHAAAVKKRPVVVRFARKAQR